MTKEVAVAFCCLGNICRSPMAEAIFKHKVKERGLEKVFTDIDSMGTSDFHEGDSPDHRSWQTCRRHGVQMSHRGRQVDFQRFDYIFGMDDSNVSNLKRIQPKSSKANASLYGRFKTNPKIDLIVDDPYYGGPEGFEYNFKQLEHFADSFIDHVLAQQKK